MQVRVKEFEGKKFFYIDFGSGTHGRTFFRLWISSKLVVEEKDEEGDISYSLPDFPLKAILVKGKKENSLILKPSEDHIVYNVYVRCGYRGTAYFEILEPEPVEVAEYYYYHSPLGNLGVDKGGLICLKGVVPLKIRWKRTGRLYGKPPEGIKIYYPDGRTEELDGVDEPPEID